MQNKNFSLILIFFTVFLGIMLFGGNKSFSLLVPFVFAHCDTMGGPVIKDAQKALETGNVNLVLIWVKEKDEVEIKKAFEKTLAVRKLNPEAKELADMYFFETFVRIHRAGEGVPYTGIRAAGSEVEPGIEAADKAVEGGSIDNLSKEVSSQAANKIKERFDRVIEKKKHMDESVESGREYVEAYVEFIHYVEGLHNAVSKKAGHQTGTEEKTEGHKGH